MRAAVLALVIGVPSLGCAAGGELPADQAMGVDGVYPGAAGAAAGAGSPMQPPPMPSGSAGAAAPPPGNAMGAAGSSAPPSGTAGSGAPEPEPPTAPAPPDAGGSTIDPSDAGAPQLPVEPPPLFPPLSTPADRVPSPDNPPECPDVAPENPIGDCLGLPVYLSCSYGTYNCVCDWFHWLCFG